MRFWDARAPQQDRNGGYLFETTKQGPDSNPFFCRRLRASQPKKPRPAIPGPPLKRQTSPFWEKRLGAYAIPFMGADASVVKRAVQTFVEHPRGLNDEGPQVGTSPG